MLSLLFGVFIIIIGLILVFKDAFWGLATFALFTHITPQQLSKAYIEPLSAPMLFAILTLLSYLFSTKYKNQRFSFPKPEIYYFLMLLAAMAIGVGNAYDKHSALIGLQAFFKIVVFFLLMVAIINERWKLNWFYNALILSAAWMVYKCWDLRGTTGPRFENRDGGIVMDANSFAGALVLLLPIVAYRMTYGPKWIRIGGALGTFGMIMSIMNTGSRSGFLGIIVSLLCAIYLFPRIRKKMVIALVILVISVASMPYIQKYYLPRIKGIFSSAKIEQDSSAQSRIKSWKLSVDLWKENIFFGCGLNNFGYYMGYLEEGKNWGQRGHVTHNLYLQTLSETGIVGAIGLLALLICFFIKTTKGYKKYDSFGLHRYADQVRILQVGMAGFCVVAFFLNRLMYEPIYWFFALSIIHIKLFNKDQSTAMRSVKD